ncbi:cytosine permease [Enterococcus faecalis]|nr:cytosine permease [Enterococcus faecalis]EHA7775675.1 cytosine permease [Enterococcus faecalis]EHQ8814452.1 cytosine permease [Enterococcus faecalis]EIB6801194.1 cytosine permease [Enterococcus faecalis]EKG2202608.1 cytosine permease [Enterococcus faecalis]
MRMKLKNEQQQSWLSLAFVWAGAMISVPGLIIGGTLVAGMPLWEALLTGFIGYGIIVILMILQGIQSSDLQEPSVKVASQVFGIQGSQKIISIILAIACLGWFGLQANVSGGAFTNFLKIYGIDLPVSLSSLIWGVIMLISALYGIKILKILNYFAVPVLVLVCLYGLVASLRNNGWEAVSQYTPQTAGSFMSGLSMTVGSFALGAVIAGDYSQYVSSRKDVVKAATLGILQTGLLMIGVGAVLTIASNTADITEVFMNLGFPVLGIIALILATWTTNAVNAFSGGLALINVFDIPKEKEKVAVGAAGAIGTLLAVVGILNYFTPIMSVLSAMVPPVAGVMIAAYWLINKGDRTKWQPTPGVNKLGVFSWLIGAAVGGIPVIMSFFPNAPQLPNQPLIGIVLSFVIYYFGAKRQQTNTESLEME